MLMMIITNDIACCDCCAPTVLFRFSCVLGTAVVLLLCTAVRGGQLSGGYNNVHGFGGNHASGFNDADCALVLSGGGRSSAFDYNLNVLRGGQYERMPQLVDRTCITFAAINNAYLDARKRISECGVFVCVCVWFRS